MQTPGQLERSVSSVEFLEILGVGILLAPIDIGCTIARFVWDCLERTKGSFVPER